MDCMEAKEGLGNKDIQRKSGRISRKTLDEEKNELRRVKEEEVKKSIKTEKMERKLEEVVTRRKLKFHTSQIPEMVIKAHIIR